MADVPTAQQEPLAFDCPRCGGSVEERFYGPCWSCRGQLQASQAGQARQVEVGRFEPAMHVVPNQVATKE